MISLRSCIKHSKECFIGYPNTLKWVRKNSAASRFSTHLSVFASNTSNTRKSVLWGIQTPVSGLKKSRMRLVFQPISLDILMKHSSLTLTNYRKYLFSPRTTRDWNSLPLNNSCFLHSFQANLVQPWSSAYCINCYLFMLTINYTFSCNHNN